MNLDAGRGNVAGIVLLVIGFICKFDGKSILRYDGLYGRLAQLGERHVYTVDVGGSSPSSPTTPFFQHY